MEKEAKVGIVDAQGPTPKLKEDIFKNTITFIKTAITEGAHLQKPDFASDDAWARQRNIVGIYFGSPATLEEIGTMYGIKEEAVRQIRNIGIRNLWLNCSLETQALFPKEDIGLSRPHKPRSQRSKERSSRSHGGKSASIKRKIGLGMSITQIIEEGEYSTQQVASSRCTLNEWGTNVPNLVTTHSEILELEDKLRNAQTDEEKRMHLSQVKRRFYHDHLRGDNPLFVKIEDVMKEAGLNVGWQRQNLLMFCALLKSVKFPMGEIDQDRSKKGTHSIITHRFILAKVEDKERAIKIFSEAQNYKDSEVIKCLTIYFTNPKSITNTE